MKKQDQLKLSNLPFKEFIEEIENEINDIKSYKQIRKIVEKLQFYKSNFTADNELYKLSTIEAIDGIIEDISKIEI